VSQKPEVFAVGDLRRGDVIAYPAILHREHGGIRSLLVVERIDGDYVRCLSKDGAESTVFPVQLRTNGVLLVKRAEPPEDAAERRG
jgi:hypothetical protein